MIMLSVMYVDPNPKIKKQILRHNQINNLHEKKRIVINHYGAVCSCCGENIFGFLTLSHINNDGKQHREFLKQKKKDLRSYLIEHDFKTDYKISIECYNCNMGRRGNKGICPHKGIT